MKKIREIPKQCNNYFGGTTCAVCLSTHSHDKIDVRRRNRPKPNGGAFILLETFYLNKERGLVSIPMGENRIHYTCLDVLDKAGIKYAEKQYKLHNPQFLTLKDDNRSINLT